MRVLPSALSAALVSVLFAAAPVSAAPPPEPRTAVIDANQVTRVVVISVDGLNPDAITQLGEVRRPDLPPDRRRGCHHVQRAQRGRDDQHAAQPHRHGDQPPHRPGDGRARRHLERRPPGPSHRAGGRRAAGRLGVLVAQRRRAEQLAVRGQGEVRPVQPLVAERRRPHPDPRQQHQAGQGGPARPAHPVASPDVPPHLTAGRRRPPLRLVLPGVHGRRARVRLPDRPGAHHHRHGRPSPSTTRWSW